MLAKSISHRLTIIRINAVSSVPNPFIATSNRSAKYLGRFNTERTEINSKINYIDQVIIKNYNFYQIIMQ